MENKYKIEDFKKLVEETVKLGYGRVLLEVLIQSGNIKTISVTKTEVHKFEND